MSDQAVTATPAYLLHYQVHRDTSFQVDFFTLEQGKINLLAKGARKAKPNARALYQPFRPLLISWISKDDPRILTGIEESGAENVLGHNQLACAYYLNELLVRLLPRAQPQASVFAHYALALAQLSASEPAEPTLRAFELQLLEDIGLMPNLAACESTGAALDVNERYLFYPANAKAVLQSKAEDLSILARPKEKDLAAATQLHPDGITADHGIPVSGRTLLALAAQDVSNSGILKEAKHVMRALIGQQLGSRPLNSRAMFESMQLPVSSDS
ncbi:MAG: DNA repair protein RecO [Granulosicoccaceae bacterium]